MAKNRKETESEKRGSVVANRLAENILRYGLDELRELLCDYALHFDRDMLADAEEYDEAVYLTFTDPEPGKNLRMRYKRPLQSGGRILLLFSFMGKYVQYRTAAQYVYRCEQKDEEEIRKLLESEGIGILRCATGGENFRFPTVDKLRKLMSGAGFEDRRPAAQEENAHGTARDHDGREGLPGEEGPDGTGEETDQEYVESGDAYEGDPEGWDWEEDGEFDYASDILRISSGSYVPEEEQYQYTFLELDRPFRHAGLTFAYGKLAEPLTMLEEGEFALPLVIEGTLLHPEAAEGSTTERSMVRFDTMYLESPHGCTEKISLRRVACTDVENALATTGLGNGARVFLKADGTALELGYAPEPDDMLLCDSRDLKLKKYSREELSERLHRELEENLFLQNDALTDLDQEPGGEAGESASPAQRAEKILADYLYFHTNDYAIRQSQTHPELWQSRYNLMLVADDTERALQFVEILSRNIQPEPQRCLFKESDLLDEDEGKKKTREMLEKLQDPDNLVVLYGCQEKPEVKTDEVNTAAQREKAEKRAYWYELLWEAVAELTTKNTWEGKRPGRLIIIASRMAYFRTLRFNQSIHEIACEHHLEIRDLLPGEVSRMFMKKIRDSSFGSLVDSSLEREVENYVDVVYPASKLRGMEFVEAYFGKFLSQYVLKEDKDDTLSGCIPPVRRRSVDEILEKLNSMPGMDSVVKSLRRLYYMKLSRMNDVYHMSFEGNPGTGKTMVAGMMAEMLYYMGVIKKPKCIPASAGDFRSIWRGGTDSKVKDLFRDAQGGILFIDEAYLLAGEGQDKDKFQEGIGLLIREMEDKENPDRPLVIFAGYEDRMRDLLKTNDGLSSRIKYHIKFRDYTREELCEILILMLDKAKFKIAEDDETRGLLDRLIRERMSVTNFGNARAMETLAGELMAQHAERAAERAEEQQGASRQTEADDVIGAEDIRALLPEPDTRQITKILETQPKVKAEFEKLQAGIAYRKRLRTAALPVHIPAASHHMVFRGAPGTGKTTVARLLADYLCEREVLPTSKLITVEIQDLENDAGNMTPARNMEEFVERARGGILFMDEAYTLLKKGYCWSVIQVLLTKMEERREDTVFIFAGYPEEMDQFVGLNKGFKSRIGYNFLFESYKEDVLATMFLDKMEQAGLRFDDTEKAREKLERIMRYFSGMPDFGNGRFVDEIFDMTVNRHAENLLKKHSEAASGTEGGEFADYPEEELITYSVESDLPASKDILESRGIKDDPETREKYEKRMTAIHELGHAVVLAAFRESMMAGARRAGEYPVNIKVVTIRPQYPAGGWVEWEPNYAGQANRTERYYKERLAWGMAGRAAEKLYFGSHTPGCSQDYWKAKSTAEQMIGEFAMGDLGITSPMDLVREADETASRLLVENREFIDIAVDFLVRLEEIEGAKFEEAFHIYRTEGGEALRDYLNSLSSSGQDGGGQEKTE